MRYSQSSALVFLAVQRTGSDADAASQQPISAMRQVHLEAVVERLPGHDSERREGGSDDGVAARERANVHERPALCCRCVER